MKRMISLIISSLFLLSVLLFTCEGTAEGNSKILSEGAFDYCVLEDETVMIVHYNGLETGAQCKIPEKINGRTVTAVDRLAFKNAEEISSIFIPETITSLPDNFLQDCHQLQSITVDKNNLHYASIDGVLFNKDHTELLTFPISKTKESYSAPAGVKIIGTCAFRFSKAKVIKLPNSVEVIGQHAFDFTNAKRIVLGNGVKKIGIGAFYQNWQQNNGGNLRKILVPKSVTKIGRSAFVMSPQMPTIYGFKGSYIEKYCKKAEINFCSVDLPAPNKTTVKAGEGAITVSYENVKKAQGIQIKIMNEEKSIVKTIHTTESMVKTINNLDASVYKVKVRVFRNVLGTRVYSPWSVQSVRVK